ncbi:hypothetical protein RRG08_016216 [Elysia crispata]|uniref:Secreted protein n=1 Tax=Elysia crispata TaxID=231223 RepID=A0AAE1DKV2_9GAST|nr:hypothetical protein RRG08_016216 [Elysia crispata]
MGNSIRPGCCCVMLIIITSLATLLRGRQPPPHAGAPVTVAWVCVVPAVPYSQLPAVQSPAPGSSLGILGKAFQF